MFAFYKLNAILTNESCALNDELEINSTQNNDTQNIQFFKDSFDFDKY